MKGLLLTVLISLSIPLQLQARELYISSGFAPPLTNLFELVLAELDNRLESVDITFKPMAAERSVRLVQEGTNDGDCCRVPAVFKDDDSVVFVQESFASIRWNAFAWNKKLKINSFNDLQPHAVGAVSGWKLAVNKIRKIAPQDYQILDTPEQMFMMLSRRRLDVGVIGYLNGLNAMADLEITDVHALQPPLASTPLYFMLAKKNRDLVPQIEAALVEMKRDGTIARFQESVEMDFLRQ